MTNGCRSISQNTGPYLTGLLSGNMAFTACGCPVMMLYNKYHTTVNLKGNVFHFDNLNSIFLKMYLMFISVFLLKIFHVQLTMSVYLIVSQSGIRHNKDLTKIGFLLVNDTVPVCPPASVKCLWFTWTLTCRLTCWGKVTGVLHNNETARQMNRKRESLQKTHSQSQIYAFHEDLLNLGLY